MTDSFPFLNLLKQYEPLRREILDAIDRVLASGQWILGSEVKALEEELTPLCGAEAIGCASGTDAIYLALHALDIGPGDDVVIPTFTFFATAGAVVRTGARPVFADVSPDPYNMTAETLEAALTPQTKAVIAVHLFGQCAPMDELEAVLDGRDIPIIEDAAQSMGARWNDAPAGSMGRLGAFSFYPTKNLGGCGDGGLVTTQNADLAKRVRQLRVHGAYPKYFHHQIGTNSRLDGIQAAILRVKLRYLDKWVARRQEIARTYNETFSGMNSIQAPVIDSRAHCVWNQYTIRVIEGSRDELRASMSDRGIPTGIYYPLSLHLQPCFEYLGQGQGTLPVSERLTEQVLSLPVDPEMTPEMQGRVIEAIQSKQPA